MGVSLYLHQDIQMVVEELFKHPSKYFTGKLAILRTAKMDSFEKSAASTQWRLSVCTLAATAKSLNGANQINVHQFYSLEQTSTVSQKTNQTKNEKKNHFQFFFGTPNLKQSSCYAASDPQPVAVALQAGEANRVSVSQFTITEMTTCVRSTFFPSLHLPHKETRKGTRPKSGS